MSRLLQEKDDQWRGRRPNGATPVFDPGLSPLGTDDEAGGAPARAGTSSDHGARQAPLPTSPDRNAPGLRLSPTVWYAVALALVLLLLAAGWLSFRPQ